MMPKSLWMHQGASPTGLTYTGEDGHGKDNLSSGPWWLCTLPVPLLPTEPHLKMPPNLALTLSPRLLLWLTSLNPYASVCPPMPPGPLLLAPGR